MAHNEQELRKEMERKEVELRESKEDLALTKKDLVNTQAELDKANDKLTVHAATLQETEKMLAEKIKEGKMFLQLLHQQRDGQYQQRLMAEQRLSPAGQPVFFIAMQ